jgi:hypothetical protein
MTKDETQMGAWFVLAFSFVFLLCIFLVTGLSFPMSMPDSGACVSD